ncbi:hypothetical protein XH86_14200 [Bradyrhizobium guangdongense]|uniref:Uncharacterized protein n=1 Tax=Bradyrhizobium guangdongense TaxID=1325090 RepID=A0ABX6UI42_9BRAD|nr:hypothetical protein X265_14195 [Bradyrhizobium guangdongense]QOZ59754.1 hypothetical protein XH86_14200 [Bradyrhizobium guangdongense]
MRGGVGRLRRPFSLKHRGKASAAAKRRVGALSSWGLSHCGDTPLPNPPPQAGEGAHYLQGISA